MICVYCGKDLDEAKDKFTTYWSEASKGAAVVCEDCVKKYNINQPVEEAQE